MRCPRSPAFRPGLVASLLLALTTGCSTPPAMTTDTAALDRELAALVHPQQGPLLAVAALAVHDGRVVYARQFGSRHLGGDGAPPLPVTERTLFRVASISKLVVTLGVLRLVEQGRLDLDEDVSLQLGWPLRHPQFPAVPITLRLLLSHRSGLSDDGENYLFDGRTRLQDVLTRGASNWARDTAPGTRFEYVNLNFGVVAQVMERASGERFDRLMQRLVLQPLGLRGGFDPASFTPADQQDIATLYRKRRTEAGRDVWDPSGPWVVQADDFRHQPPQPPAGSAGYAIGSNGALYGPQGRLRTGLHDLGVLLQMLLADGRHQGRAFLSPDSVALLGAEHWRLDAARSNGDPTNDWALSWGLGVQRFTDATHGPGRGDRLVDGGGFSGWGHSGDAYGLLGLFALDPARRSGFVLLLAGPAVDPATQPGAGSAWTRWQERAATALARHLRAGSPPP